MPPTPTPRRRPTNNTPTNNTRSNNTRSNNKGTSASDTPRNNRGSRSGDSRSGGGRKESSRPREDQRPRTTDQTTYDGPPLPEHITGRELDHTLANQLKGLPEKLANRIARHLLAATELIDTDPETAYQHTLAARARAPRLALIREATGEAAYAAGHYTQALAELRAAKRINGTTAYLPIMADCERALGRPERALTLAKNPAITNFTPQAKAEMTIVEAAARRDMGNYNAALATLEHAPLHTNTREPWVTRLRYTYADTLQQAGRPQEALEWFHRTHATDNQQHTDAAQRAHTLEQTLNQTN